MNDTFESLIDQCAKAGEPFQCLVRKSDGTYQASVRSKYSKGSHNAFACGHGATPTEALRNTIAERKAVAAVEEVDPLS